MKVLDAEFVTSAAGARGVPRDGLPQIALVGRSNVGKSTLINALAGRPIARTSAKPGKTRLANLYRVHLQGRLRASEDPDALRREPGSGAPVTWRLYLVDLPGYGYTRGGSRAHAEFARITEEYFGGAELEIVPGLISPGPGPREIRPGTISVLLIVDARHPGLEPDLAARDWLDTIAVPYVVVATKLDKLSRNARPRIVRELERHFNRPVLPVSGDTGEGLDELWRQIAKLASRPRR